MFLPFQIKSALAIDPSGHALQVHHKTADFGITASMSGSLFTNKGASGAVTFSLPASPPPGIYFLFSVRAAQELRIDPPSGGAIIINGAALTDGNYVTANAINESVLLYSDGDNSNDWVAMFTTGTWTEEGA